MNHDTSHPAVESDAETLTVTETFYGSMPCAGLRACFDSDSRLTFVIIFPQKLACGFRGELELRSTARGEATYRFKWASIVIDNGRTCSQWVPDWTSGCPSGARQPRPETARSRKSAFLRVTRSATILHLNVVDATPIAAQRAKSPAS